MQITFRAETEVHEERHRVLEREICEFFVVLESANQPVDHTTCNESRLHRTPAQAASGHRIEYDFQLVFHVETRKLCERETRAGGQSAPEAELLQCGEDVLACEGVDRIDARGLRRGAHSGCRLLLLRGALQLVHEALHDRRLLREVRAACGTRMIGMQWSQVECVRVQTGNIIGWYVNQEMKVLALACLCRRKP